MSTSQTRLTVYNMALDVVSEGPAQSLQELRVEVQWLNRNYERVVESAIRANLWNFAMEWHETEADGGYTASPSWRHRFSFPNGALRLAPPREGGLINGRPISHRVAGDKVFTNHGNTLYGWWAMRRLEPGTWDPLFVDVIAATLGAGMANRFTRKASYLDLATRLRNEALDVAEQVNAFEGSADETEEYDIIRARA